MGEGEAVHGWAKGMKPEVVFLLLVLFHLEAQQVMWRQGHRGHIPILSAIFT